jgi:carbamoyl-phosphate synthase large subunit
MPVDRPGRVLVTGAGGPSGIAVMRSIESPTITTFAGDIDPYAAGLYLVAAEQRRILPRGDDPGFVDRIAQLCERDEIDVVVPTVDSELLPLARERDRFAAAGVTLVLASEQTLAVCLDKWALDARCRDVVRTPQTWLVDETFDPLAPELPVIVKPRSGSGSRGIRLLGAREQLSALERDGTLLVQEHLPGPEYSLDVLASAEGEVLAVVPRARLKVDSGIAITGRTLHDPVLEEFGAAVARLIDLTTVANVQAKEAADGTPALLEVNPRFPGTMPLTIAAGIDMPSLAVGEALGAPPPTGTPPLPFEEVAMVRTFTETFFGFEQIEAMQAQAAAGGAEARA